MTQRITLKTLWFQRKHATSPELLVAWDEYSVDENSDGFEDACEKAYAEVKNDDAGTGPRFIDIHAEYDPIEQAFLPAEATATSEPITPEP